MHTQNEAAPSVGFTPAIDPRPWKEATLWELLVVPGWGLSYCAVNAYTAQLPPAQVHEISMGWERSVPFLPWTIVPYLTVDLMMLVMPFLLRTRRELRAYFGRILLGTAISLACFVLFPLRFGPVRPEVSGILGVLFEGQDSLDQPYNQAPSLHISLLVIAWTFYRRYFPARWIFLLNLGSVLIAMSVLTTWQHHVVDIPTGFAVGVLVCRLIPVDVSPSAAAPPRSLQAAATRYWWRRPLRWRS